METERLSPRYSGIDIWDPADVLDAMIDGPVRRRRGRARGARGDRAGGARHGGATARRRPAGLCRRRHLGRLAVQDGAELMPTFSWPQDRLLLFIAGGNEALLRAVEGAEDEAEHAVDLVKRHDMSTSTTR